MQGREAILKVHAKKVKIADNVDFSVIAKMAAGASGAELANMVNEAALRAVRAGRKFVTQARLRRECGSGHCRLPEEKRDFVDHEKIIVAYHEIGHALVAALQSHSAPVTKITIIPRTSERLAIPCRWKKTITT